MRENPLKDKSFSFALKIVLLTQNLQNSKKEFVLSRQLLKSGTSIGAMIREAEFGQSKADFISKYSIALKEANETEYWLELLNAAEYIDESTFNDLKNKNSELIAMLVSSIKTSKEKIK
ncbi:MAG: four helix bundle protein [Saprospiraceae bacterium]|nr:four helix bundle protein [Saprospiraceae bacterium]